MISYEFLTTAVVVVAIVYLLAAALFWRMGTAGCSNTTWGEMMADVINFDYWDD